MESKFWAQISTARVKWNDNFSSPVLPCWVMLWYGVQMRVGQWWTQTTSVACTLELFFCTHRTWNILSNNFVEKPDGKKTFLASVNFRIHPFFIQFFANVRKRSFFSCYRSSVLIPILLFCFCSFWFLQRQLKPNYWILCKSLGCKFSTFIVLMFCGSQLTAKTSHAVTV